MNGSMGLLPTAFRYRNFKGFFHSWLLGKKRKQERGSLAVRSFVWAAGDLRNDLWRERGKEGATGVEPFSQVNRVACAAQ